MSDAWTLQPHLDRAAGLRGDPELLAGLWRSDGSRLLVVDADGRVALPLGEATTGRFDGTRTVFLGTVDAPGASGVAWFAQRGEVHDGVTLRDAELDATGVELVSAATAVLAWHDAAPFCERCGSATVVAAGGFQRHCTGCGRELFPRTDPAMIVAVLDDDDRLLLAHQASWPAGRVSILAGFLEAGESAEHAVVREVHEESGLGVAAVRYLTSQPWPYPRSLMLSFAARATGEVQVDGEEIAWARWYSPSDLDAAEADGLTLPGKGSVAGRMLDAWRRGELDLPC